MTGTVRVGAQESMSAAVITLIKKYMLYKCTIHALNYGKLVV